MGTCTYLVLFATILCAAQAQFPRRIQIPGAVSVGGSLAEPRPLPYRRVLPAQALGPAPKLRRPIPLAQPVRPVIEESAEEDDGPLSRDEVSKLQNIPVASPAPQPVRVPPPPQRIPIDDDEEDYPPVRQIAQPAPIQFRPAPQVRLTPQPAPQRPQQVQRAAAPARPRQPTQSYAQDDDERRPATRGRKPPIKILRKYREDNPDGSITWGYENDDGSFKEETIGTDCITRGKYGYVDPDGNRREYTYETGLKCDAQEEELPEEPLPFVPNNKLKRPQPLPVRLQ